MILEICAVVAAVALVAIAVVTVRTLLRFEKAAEELSLTIVAARDALGQVQPLARELRELVQSLRRIVPPLEHTVSRVEEIGERVLGMTSSLIQEVETPVRLVAGVLRGVRAGTWELVQRLRHRLRGRFHPFDGEESFAHEPGSAYPLPPMAQEPSGSGV